MKKERKKERDRLRGQRGRERQKGVNHSAVINTNTQREHDGKLTEAFYIGAK